MIFPIVIIAPNKKGKNKMKWLKLFLEWLLTHPENCKCCTRPRDGGFRPKNKLDTSNPPGKNVCQINQKYQKEKIK